MGQQSHENVTDAGDPRDRELPDPSPREAKKLRQETRRADKWIKMLKRWDHYLPSEKLRRRVYKGVPPQVRGQVWLRLLNVDQVKARNAGKYQAMKEAALVSSRDIVQIDLDVNRTFRSHTMFWDRYGVGQRALFYVLAAYSVYNTDGARVWTLTDGTTNESPGGEGSHSPEGHEAEAPRRPPPSTAHSRRVPEDPSSHAPRPHGVSWPSSPCGTCQGPQEVGYCQGMSEIAAILLMFLPEEDAFWALAQLMVGDRHSMHGFFIPGFPKLLRFQSHHERVLQRALPDLRKHMDEEQMSTGIYSPKWFLQCFLGRTPFSLTLKLWDAYVLDGERVLTAMAYTILKVHRKRLLKLPLEGLREFLQDSLAQPWALEDEAVLRHLRASMTQLRRMRCDLPPQAGPEEFPTRPLGLEPVSPAPGPLLPSPASEPPPRVEEPASLGPAARPEPPGPPPGQTIVQLAPQPQRWNSIPTLPGQQGGAGRRPWDTVGFKTENGVSFHSAPAWATPEAPRRTGPWSTPGTPITGSPQPPRDDAVGPRTPFLPRGHCSSCPSLGSEGHSQGRARAALSPLPRGPAQARDPLPPASTGQLDARGPRGQSVAVRAGARRLRPAVTVPCLVSLSLPEGGTPRMGHQPLTQRDLGWPGPGLFGGRGDSSACPRPSANGIQRPGALARPAFWPRAERALSQQDVASWALGVPHRSRSLT
ncbi:USP6 N-terminal-like protein [Vulpes lagopus]